MCSAASLSVVPAKAGTHTPQPLDRTRRMGPGPRALRSPGTTFLALDFIPIIDYLASVLFAAGVISSDARNEQGAARRQRMPLDGAPGRRRTLSPEGSRVAPDAR